MKSTSGTNWISRTHRDSPTPSDYSSTKQPLTPTYTSPRLAPPPPPSSIQKSSFKTIQSVFRKQNRPPSIHSAYSASSNSSAENHPTHPYSTMHTPPVPVVSNRETVEDEDECPVCLEPLSFSFRLPGEKPHIVPECGHALHEVRVIFSNYLSLPLTIPRHASPPYMAHLQAKAAPLYQGKLISASVAYVDGL